MNSVSGPQPAFDNGQHYLLQHHPQQPSPSPSTRSRKRAATDDQDINPKLLAKRAKAAERQRRKRERDRRASAINEQQRLANFVPPGLAPQRAAAAHDGHAVEQHSELPQQPQQPQPLQAQHPPPPPPQSADASTQTVQPPIAPAYPVPPPPDPMPPQPQTEEEVRKERVRAAARERQRKHRALVKRKKLMELGVQMGDNGLMPEELTYTLGPDGNYTPTHPQNQDGSSELADAGQEIPGSENGFLPDGTTQSGGQTFASYILLAMSCSPLLKQHLLRQLHMTNEDLHSLEPVLCTAFEHWDQARREAFAAEQMKMQGSSDGPQEQPSDSAGSSHIPAPSSTETTVSPNASTDPNDFRTRFHRSLVAPSPFTVASHSSDAPNGTSAEQEHAVTITTESIQQQLEQALPTSIDPRLSRLPPNITFAEIVAKMAAAAAGANLTVNPEIVKQTMNGTGDTGGLVDVDANEGAEVEEELGDGNHSQ